jgi:PIN domain nuclease of toxin-antitoxin system
MVRKTYLDTHIVAWLYSGKINKISRKTQKIIEESNLFISPMVKLELEFLYEINRLKKGPDDIINYLSKEISLEICCIDFLKITNEALKYSFTKDPFDRIIVAQASFANSYLVSHDDNIVNNYKLCIS